MLDAYLRQCRKRVESALRKAVPSQNARPRALHEAMRHSLFPGGKRLRPVLVLAAAEACGGDPNHALPLACAVECIHTFSLIHDDLPCMDDDALRRGRPTCHVLFGEAMALLAGDALQALAFEIAASHPGTRRYPAGEMVRVLAHASGSRCLIGGQVLDIAAENDPDISFDALRQIHEGKTAALLEACLRLGAMSANATPARLEALARFGRYLGLAFQVVDDILDVTQSSEKLGKTAGKDAHAGKATYVSVLGMAAASTEAGRLTDKALDALDPLGKPADMLRAIAHRMLHRDR